MVVLVLTKRQQNQSHLYLTPKEGQRRSQASWESYLGWGGGSQEGDPPGARQLKDTKESSLNGHIVRTGRYCCWRDAGDPRIVVLGDSCQGPSGLGSSVICDLHDNHGQPIPIHPIADQGQIIFCYVLGLWGSWTSGWGGRPIWRVWPPE